MSREEYEILENKAKLERKKALKALKVLENCKLDWLNKAINKHIGLMNYRKERKRLLKLVKKGNEDIYYLRKKRGLSSLRYRTLKSETKRIQDEKQPQSSIEGWLK